MPFPFTLPTTSRLSFSTHFTSSTHPSLPSIATNSRNVLYSALKAHKRLQSGAQVKNYQSLLNVLLQYLPYLLAIDAGLSGRLVSGEEVDIALASEIEVEWRSTLGSSGLSGRDHSKIKGKGLDFELFYVLNTLALLHSLLARQSCLRLYVATLPSAEERLAIIQTATKSLGTASEIHLHLQQLINATDSSASFPTSAVDVSVGFQSALTSLVQAEITLCFALKDDPYPAILLQHRNKDNRDWMIKAPEIPKVRAQVLVRLCVGAAEHAKRAADVLNSETRGSNKALSGYCEDISRSARAKACRFTAIALDLSGETGKAIAWLQAGTNELGLEIDDQEEKSRGGLNQLKATWKVRKEDKRLEKGSGAWGMDGGISEETRIINWLKQRWTKMNNTINVQLVPDWKPLAAGLPTGRAMPAKTSWIPPSLNEEELGKMRAPPEDEVYMANDDSSDEDLPMKSQPVGAFPGTGSNYGRDEYY